MSVEKTSPAQEANTMQITDEKMAAATACIPGGSTLSQEERIEIVRGIAASLSTDAEPVKTAPAVAVKALEWRDEPVPPSGETLAPSVVGLYCIPHSGDRFYLRFRDAITLGDYSTLDKAKAAAQADYEARILSTLSAQVQDDSEIVNCLLEGKPFVFDPATHFCHADDGGAPEYGIKYVPAEQGQDVAGWQEISTAPRDGTKIL